MAIIVPNNKKSASCSIKGRKIEWAALSVGGYSSLPDFSWAARLEPDWRLDHFVDDLEKLWTLIQQGGCSGVIVTGAEAGTLLSAFEREKKRYTLLPPLDASELHAAYAKIRGFSSLAQLTFAIALKASATEVKALAEFTITDAKSHRAALDRMHRSGYSKSTDASDLITFLQDEAEGAKIKRSAVQIRVARAAAAEAEERERAERIQREMPLYSVQLMCMEPMGHLAETLVGHLARSPAVFIQMITGSVSQFCQQLALPVSNPDVIAGARLIANDASGAQYFVAKAPDGRSVLGLIKRRGG